MNEELAIAIAELRKRPSDRAWFLPVLLSPDALPYRSIGAGETLHDIHYVDLADDWDDGVSRLLAVINQDAAVPKAKDGHWEATTSGRPMTALASQDGPIVRDPEGRVWIIYGGAKFRFPDRETLEWLFPTRASGTLPPSLLKTFRLCRVMAPYFVRSQRQST